MYNEKKCQVYALVLKIPGLIICSKNLMLEGECIDFFSSVSLKSLSESHVFMVWAVFSGLDQPISAIMEIRSRVKKGPCKKEFCHVTNMMSKIRKEKKKWKTLYII